MPKTALCWGDNAVHMRYFLLFPAPVGFCASRGRSVPPAPKQALGSFLSLSQATLAQDFILSWGSPCAHNVPEARIMAR